MIEKHFFNFFRNDFFPLLCRLPWILMTFLRTSFFFFIIMLCLLYFVLFLLRWQVRDIRMLILLVSTIDSLDKFFTIFILLSHRRCFPFIFLEISDIVFFHLILNKTTDKSNSIGIIEKERNQKCCSLPRIDIESPFRSDDDIVEDRVDLQPAPCSSSRMTNLSA